MSDIIDRESLLIYLNDLRTMETIIYESDKKIESVNKKRRDLKSDFDADRHNAPSMPIEPLKPTEDPTKNIELKYDTKSGWYTLVGAAVFVIGAIIGGGGFFSMIFGFMAVLLAIIGIGLILSISSEKSKVNEDYDLQMEKYEIDMNKYEIEKNKYYKRLENSEKQYNEAIKKTDHYICDLISDKNYISKRLRNAYDVNIIPLQFRNIQGIYYLYDYISTSNQSLSEALMQCNLEAIKEKLDNVIQLHSKAIIQQAEANAALYEQNQKILETAQATMNNTAVAAKYAQIAAINSELSLKLQEKSLAYQSADFWLK